MTRVHDLTRRLQKNNGSKIVLLVSDGLGGLPLEAGGRTELETANTPNLDALGAGGARFMKQFSSTPTCPPARGACRAVAPRVAPRGAAAHKLRRLAERVDVHRLLGPWAGRCS